jgi:hypothetical protein
MAGRLTKVSKAFYLFTMPGHPFPDSSVLTNSARSYLRRPDFLMSDLFKRARHLLVPTSPGLLQPI